MEGNLTVSKEKLPCSQRIILYLLLDKQQGEQNWTSCHPLQIVGLTCVVPGCHQKSKDTLDFPSVEVWGNWSTHYLYLVVFCGGVSTDPMMVSGLLVRKSRIHLQKVLLRPRLLSLSKQHSDIAAVSFKAWALSGDDILWIHLHKMQFSWGSSTCCTKSFSKHFIMMEVNVTGG